MSEENKNCCRTANLGATASLPTGLVAKLVGVFSKKQAEKVCDFIKKIDFKTKDKNPLQVGLVPCVPNDEDNDCDVHHDLYLGIKFY